MKLETSYDKVTLDHQEVQQAIKEYLAKRMPDRVVRGDIVTINAPQREEKLAESDMGRRLPATLLPKFVEKNKPCVTTTAYLYLEPASLEKLINGTITAQPIAGTFPPSYIDGDMRALKATDTNDYIGGLNDQKNGR